MDHKDMWWATYRAALTGFCSLSFHEMMELVRVNPKLTKMNEGQLRDEFAKRQANIAHGPIE